MPSIADRLLGGEVAILGRMAPVGVVERKRLRLPYAINSSMTGCLIRGILIRS